MPLSFANRMAKGDTYEQLFKHALKREMLLLLLGWGLYCMGPDKVVFRFQNVLAQLSVTYLLAFLIIRKPTVFKQFRGLYLLIFRDFNEHMRPER